MDIKWPDDLKYPHHNHSESVCGLCFEVDRINKMKRDCIEAYESAKKNAPELQLSSERNLGYAQGYADGRMKNAPGLVELEQLDEKVLTEIVDRIVATDNWNNADIVFEMRQRFGTPVNKPTSHLDSLKCPKCDGAEITPDDLTAEEINNVLEAQGESFGWSKSEPMSEEKIERVMCGELDELIGTRGSQLEVYRGLIKPFAKAVHQKMNALK